MTQLHIISGKVLNLGVGPYSKLHKHIELRDHLVKAVGKGLFAKAKILEGEVVWFDDSYDESMYRTLHEMVLKINFKGLMQMEREDPARYRFATHFGEQIGMDFYIFPSEELLKLNYQFYFNHSCEPKSYQVGDTYLVAACDIHIGEEITYDYSMCETVLDRLPHGCFCRTKLCRGSVFKDDWKRADLQERYKGHWSRHVQALIDAAQGG